MPHAEAPRVISVQKMKQPLQAVLAARPAVQAMAIPSPNRNPPPVARLAAQETNSKKRR